MLTAEQEQTLQTAVRLLGGDVTNWPVIFVDNWDLLIDPQATANYVKARRIAELDAEIADYDASKAKAEAERAKLQR